MVVSPLPITERETRDAAVAELLRTEAIYVSDMKVCHERTIVLVVHSV